MKKNLGISTLLDFYSELLTDKQKQVLNLYYNEDLSLAEIAQNQGITRQGVYDTIKKAEGQLFELEKKLKLFQKFINMEKNLGLIIKNSESLLSLTIDKFDNVKMYASNIRNIAKSIYNEQ